MACAIALCRERAATTSGVLSASLLQVDVASNPPRLGSRADMSLWLCEQHNVVNELTGTPAFPCDLAALDVRWRTGRPECWGGGSDGDGAGGETAAESLGQELLAGDDDNRRD